MWNCVSSIRILNHFGYGFGQLCFVLVLGQAVSFPTLVEEMPTDLQNSIFKGLQANLSILS